MAPIALAILMLVVAIALLVGELLLPTHGVLGILAFVCGLVVVVACYQIGPNIGLTVFILLVLLTPVVLGLMLQMWTHGPMGRALTLAPERETVRTTQVYIGLVGTTLTELRPAGECDFGEFRSEVFSERGMVPAGSQVRVVAIVGGRPTVRQVNQSAADQAASDKPVGDQAAGEQTGSDHTVS